MSAQGPGDLTGTDVEEADLPSVATHGEHGAGKRQRSHSAARVIQVTHHLNNAGSTVRALAFSSTMLAVGGDGGKIRLFDIGTGKVARTLGGHQGGTHGLAFSSDGKQLASVGNDHIGRVRS